jgi:hypothetical protein
VHEMKVLADGLDSKVYRTSIRLKYSWCPLTCLRPKHIISKRKLLV